MSLSINAITSNQLTTDKQRARATEFVNRNDREISHMAHRTYNITHRESDKKFSSNIKTALFSLPLVALASGLALKKGIKPSLKSSADWGAAVIAPVLVTGASKAVSKADANGKKHDNLSFGAHLALSLGAYFGASSAIEIASRNKTVNKVADTVINGAKDTFGKLKSDIKIPAKLTNVFKKVADTAKPIIEKAKSSALLSKAGAGAAKIGRKAVEHAPMLLAVGMVGSVLLAAVKQASQVSAIKSNIKSVQLDTARNLIDSYQVENAGLKAENTKLEEAFLPSDEE